MFLFAALLSLILLFQLVLGGTKDWTDADLSTFETRSTIPNRVYLFYADWCSACRRFKPEFEKSMQQVFEKHPDVEVIRINLDAAPTLSKSFKVTHLPSLFHETNGQVRNINQFRGNMLKFFDEKLWSKVNPFPVGDSQLHGVVGAGQVIKASKYSLVNWVNAQGVSFPVFITTVTIFAMMVVMFVIWMVWLYTDYKLNGHRLTEEAIQERVRLLRKLENEEFGKDRESDSDEDESDEDGNESDDENEPLKSVKRKSAVRAH